MLTPKASEKRPNKGLRTGQCWREKKNQAMNHQDKHHKTPFPWRGGRVHKKKDPEGSERKRIDPRTGENFGSNTKAIKGSCQERTRGNQKKGKKKKGNAARPWEH